jgi:cell division protein FtsL
MGEELMPIEVHFEKRIINNNVIREADLKGHRDYIIVTVLAAMFLFGLFAYGWQDYQWNQYGYRIQEAKKKKEQLTEIRERLKLEHAWLASPQRIDSIARRELGMVVPEKGQLVLLHADAPLTIPAPQTAQPAPPVPAQQARTEPPLQAQPAALEAAKQ